MVIENEQFKRIKLYPINISKNLIKNPWQQETDSFILYTTIKTPASQCEGQIQSTFNNPKGNWKGLIQIVPLLFELYPINSSKNLT